MNWIFSVNFFTLAFHRLVVATTSNHDDGEFLGTISRSFVVARFPHNFTIYLAHSQSSLACSPEGRGEKFSSSLQDQLLLCHE